MTDTIQLLVVGMLVAAAAAYVVRAAWKTWFGKSRKACGSGCGSCSAPVPERKEDGRFPLPQA